MQFLSQLLQLRLLHQFVANLRRDHCLYRSCCFEQLDRFDRCYCCYQQLRLRLALDLWLLLLITVVCWVVAVLAVGLLMILSLLLSYLEFRFVCSDDHRCSNRRCELPFTISFDQPVAGTFIELDTNVGLLIIELPNELEPDPVRTADETELSTIVFVSLLTVTGTDFSVDLSTYWLLKLLMVPSHLFRCPCLVC